MKNETNQPHDFRGESFENVHEGQRTTDIGRRVPAYTIRSYMSLVVRKPDFCICENKGADQLRGNREADQRLCFRYIDSTIPLLPIYEISSL